MRYSDVKSAVISVLSRTPSQAVAISGPPGVAKSSLAFEVAEHFGIPRDRIWVNHAPLADQVDYRGVPIPNGDVTRWLPAEDVARFRKGTGPGLILHDDRGQASTQVKNVIARLLLDRAMDSIEIDDEVIQISTTNRTEDKAGSSRDPSQLSNREAGFEMEAHLDDWCAWAMSNDIDPYVIAFLRLRPNLLHDFDPNRPRNPTPRTWEMVSRSCDPALDRGLFFECVRAFVGDGAATEFVAARDLMAKMPNIDAILLDPAKAEVPKEPAVLFAVSTALAMRSTKDNFDRVLKYFDRLPAEFSVMGVKDAYTRDKSLNGTKAFTEWAIKNSKVFE